MYLSHNTNERFSIKSFSNVLFLYLKEKINVYRNYSTDSSFAKHQTDQRLFSASSPSVMLEASLFQSFSDILA